MSFRFPLLVAVALMATTAWAQKPVERSPLEIGEDALEVTVADGTGRFLVETTGQPRVLSFLNHAVTPGTPEAMAREFLAAEFGTLRLGSPMLEDLELVRTSERFGGATVRFRQSVDGVPVLAPETVVRIDQNNRVQFVLNEYRALSLDTTTPSIPADAARSKAFEHLGVKGVLHFDETNLVVYPTPNGAVLAWQVRVLAETPRGEWEAIVDAQDGSFLRVADRMLYHSSDDEEHSDDPPVLAPTVEAANAMRRVDGTGFVFHPDPLTRAGVSYGTPGYVDGNDANTPQLEAARSAVTLRDITFDGTNYHLDGPYADILDWDAPFKGEFEQPSSDWSVNRFDDAFEATNSYFHIDRMMRYINETLGIALMPRQYNSGVRIDPHGWNGQDQSSYSSGTGRLTMGEGCVDDAEDADVTIHELGHGLHDWLSGISQTQGLSEGLGDFFANSYTRHLGLLTPSDPSYYWVFKWDGHNPCWSGRRTNYTATYPGGLTGSRHTDGQIWSSALMQIWEDIGGEATDAVVIAGIDMTNTGTSQPVAAQAVLQASADLGYPITDRQAIFGRFTARGYNVTMPPPPVANEPSTDLPVAYTLSEAYPNPFNPAATFTLQVAVAQDVTVALYDGLGRQVRTLFSGAMGANERQTIVIDASALASGLYVYRVTGETFSASRRVTLVK